jgi:hypothetical protein
MQDQIIQHLKQRKMSMDALYQALLLVDADDYKALAKTPESNGGRLFNCSGA